MNRLPPFVVLVGAVAGGVGQSSLARNLAVYLKGLAEQLPVAYLSTDLQSAAAMFALPGGAAEPVPLAPGGELSAGLTLGEYGVEYGALTKLTDGPPNWLRRQLFVSEFSGILIIETEQGHPAVPAALAAADLVLVPVKAPSDLGALQALRRAFVASGGAAEQFCLLPSELGESGRYNQVGNELLQFLRFAAVERDFRVLTGELVVDLQARQLALEKQKSVLTRARQSRLHPFLQQLAEQVLEERQQQCSFASQMRRWQADGLLPQRAGRVELTCPLCQRPTWGQQVHYLETLPGRGRLLLHPACLRSLLVDCGAAAFLEQFGLLLLRPAVACGGRSGELLLQVLDGELELLHGEAVAINSGWAGLCRAATGRWAAELYHEFLLLSAPVPATSALDGDWYRRFLQLRRGLRQACREEKI